ncbi:peroxidase-like [Amphibalanus amphitrite]|uniref:peroxidase-like n=1 Tax=Amphibalanus amphitrite TaxID=1232801 RepID=UPI001C90EAF7|nr:peroxidase-like [Amphibalanus amphitrite]
MGRSLLRLAVLLALSSAALGCTCREPTACPEAVVSESPELCKLDGGRQGVCCPTEAVTAARAATAQGSRRAPSRTASQAFLSQAPRTVSTSGGDLGSLPTGARRLLTKFPLDSADQRVPQQAARSRRPGQFSAAVPDQTALFSVRARQSPREPSGTTRLNALNARTSPEAQRSAARSLQTLQRVQARAASAAPRTTRPPRVTRPPRLLTSSLRRIGIPTLPSFSPTNFRNVRAPRAVLSIQRPVGVCVPEKPLNCNSGTPHRTYDGSCNNLYQTHWGRRLRGLRRLFDSTYWDSVYSPRIHSAAGGLLPSARLVSAQVMSSSSVQHQLFTTAVTVFGQFADHDLSISPIFHRSGGYGSTSPIECCEPNHQFPAQPLHPQCFPIPVAANDPFYQTWNVRCHNFVRSIPAPDPQCLPRPATQLNDITTWLDLSQVYGSERQQARGLRTSTGGRLKTSTGNLLPRQPPPSGECVSGICFLAGDTRANENTLLTLLHTVLVREHNRVAAALAARHKSWSDERLYQQARRINIAQWQHIVYREWLPTIVGFQYANSVGLRGFGRYTYTPALRPDISTEFSTAAFRLHSLVQGVISLVTQHGTLQHQLKLTENYFRPDSLVVTSLFTNMARGMTQQRPQSFDRRFVQAVRGDLFKFGAFGLDLVAANIQRGRDHALPTYATVAAACGSRSITGWFSFLSFMNWADVLRLKKVYAHWQDVDLFAGINLEKRAPGAMVGPTARCVIADQFLRLRYGDRFFYDQAGQAGSFSWQQLQQLRRSSMARLLCDNVGAGFDSVQPLAFIRPIPLLNPVVDCQSYRIPKVDLSIF